MNSEDKTVSDHDLEAKAMGLPNLAELTKDLFRKKQTFVKHTTPQKNSISELRHRLASDFVNQHQHQ